MMTGDWISRNYGKELRRLQPTSGTSDVLLDVIVEKTGFVASIPGVRLAQNVNSKDPEANMIVFSRSSTIKLTLPIHPLGDKVRNPITPVEVIRG